MGQGFNGATAIQPWKPVFSSIFFLDSNASMGPRLFSRGNQEIDDEGDILGTLQWGHGYSAVETIRCQ